MPNSGDLPLSRKRVGVPMKFGAQAVSASVHMSFLATREAGYIGRVKGESALGWRRR